MKTTIGGDRLGSGNKQKVSIRNYERSTHDLSYLWRSSMAPGTLVPFMSTVALPGDSFDIDLTAEVLSLPTIGPLFGSFKVQLDVFQVPMRLYNAALHMNKLGIGMDMSSVYLPQMSVPAMYANDTTDLGDNDQINSSNILKYLGIGGIGNITGSPQEYAFRDFNAVSWLGYWDIYKNYYANKQEERGVGIHIDNGTLVARQQIIGATMFSDDMVIGNMYENPIMTGTGLHTYKVVIQFGDTAAQPSWTSVDIKITGIGWRKLNIVFTESSWNNDLKQLTASVKKDIAPEEEWEVPSQTPAAIAPIEDSTPSLIEFPLENIDKMREAILQHNPTNTPFYTKDVDLAPYNWLDEEISEPKSYSQQYSQEGLGIKTYQSDLFNNWISTEWIDGANGINEVTAVDTTGDSFTIDSLNLAQKVYNMLNRIAISGGSYDDWLDAVYTHERARSVESPMYLGSLIKELAFESVVSNSDSRTEGNTQPLGTLAGRGRLTGKNKGGKIKAKIDEPSYIIGIVSLTPRVDYSQGNKWDVNLKTINDLHKPALDSIGFQELITEQMAWQSTGIEYTAIHDTVETQKSAGKQPAWINYMTAVNQTYGNFAEENKEMFMTLNRRYSINKTNGNIRDLTTYVDPAKYNQIFAQTSLDAQNFWVQIGADVKARRKMSAKVIPNL